MTYYTYPHSQTKMEVTERRLDIKKLLNSKNSVLQSNGPNQNASNSKRVSDSLERSTSSLHADSSLKSNTDAWEKSQISLLVNKLDMDMSQNDTLLTSLQSLFISISNQKKKVGVMGPKHFIAKLKEQNEIFSGTNQQDAHEMFNYLINEISETLIKHQTEISKKVEILNDAETSSAPNRPVSRTWIQELFEGQLTNETKCLNCEMITNRDESFLDLSLDIEQNSSLSTCLRQFSKSELLCHKNKFFCDNCNSLQEAEKRYSLF